MVRAGLGEIEVAGAGWEKMVAVGTLAVVVVGKQALQLAAVHFLRSWEDARRRPAQAVREFWR